MLKAGFADTCITPPPGEEIPGLFERRYAAGVYDPLYARAAVVDDGERCVALVQVDAIVVAEDLVAGARKQANALCGIPPENCFIGATHTHSGGPVFSAFESEGDTGYAAFVAQQIAAAITEAHRVRRPALAGSEADNAEGVAFNRRFIMKDGTQRTHPGRMNPDIVEPAGPADPTVTVAGFRAPDNFRPFGCIVNFACHGTHMNGYLYSADYPRWIVDSLQAVYGPDFGVVFLNGACGDVTQVDNRTQRPSEFGPYWCERTGRAVGGAAIEALARMDYYGEVTVARKAAIVSAAIRAITPEALEAARALLAGTSVKGANQEIGVPGKDIETIYAQELLKVEAMRAEKPGRDLEIAGIRIADALFWGVPAEFFQAFALEVRAASPFRHTCCVELANGYDGYICTKAAFKGGGYEIRTARSSFLEEDAGENIVAAMTNLSKEMYADAQAEIQSLPERKVWPGSEDSALDGIKKLTTKPTG